MLCIGILLSKTVVIHVSNNKVKLMMDYIRVLNFMFKEERHAGFVLLHREANEEEFIDELREFELFSDGISPVSTDNKSFMAEIKKAKQNLLERMKASEFTVDSPLTCRW